jgi:hypothetical protein
MALKFKINGEVREESMFVGDVRLRWNEEYVNLVTPFGTSSGYVYVTPSTSTTTNMQWYDVTSGTWKNV